MPLNRASSQSGNVLIYTLIGIVLFAAVMLSLSKGNSNSSGIASKGSSKLQAQQILDYADTMEKAVQKLVLKGCSENQISFESPQDTNYSNANSPSSGDKRCWVFDPAGGNAQYKKPNPDWLDPSITHPIKGDFRITGQNRMPDIGTTDSTASSAELLYVIPFLKKEICVEINNITGVANRNGATPPHEPDFWWSNRFTGGFNPQVTVTTPELSRKSKACGGQMFYAVLLAR